MVRVLSDSASEAQLCTHDYYCEPTPANVLITGVNSSAPRTSVGFAYIRVGVDQHSRMLRLPMLSTDSISGGATQVLLTYDLHGSDVPLLSLPVLPCGVDEQWMHRYEVVATGGPFAMAAAATTISSFEELRAHVEVADASNGKILEDCGDDPFPKVAYSLDDIRWGVTALQAEIDDSGLAGVFTGGVFSLEQVRQLKAICVKYKSGCCYLQNSARQRPPSGASRTTAGPARSSLDLEASPLPSASVGNSCSPVPEQAATVLASRGDGGPKPARPLGDTSRSRREGPGGLASVQGTAYHRGCPACQQAVSSRRI